MKFLLDTDTCVEVIRGSHSSVLESFREAVEARDQLFLSSIVEFELAYGVANSDHKRQSENSARVSIFFSHPFERLPFNTKDGFEAATIRAYLKSSEHQSALTIC